MACLIYNLCANHTSNSGFDQTFMPCSGYFFYGLPNNERGTKHCGLTYSAKQNVRESVGLSIAQSKLVCEFDFHLTVSITVVRSIETPKTTPNLHQTTPNHYRIYSQYHIMLNFFKDTHDLFRGGGGGWAYAAKPPPPPPPWVWHWHCARLHTVIGLNDRQLFF